MLRHARNKASSSSSSSVQKAFTPRERLVISCMYVHIFRSNQFADQIINTAVVESDDFKIISHFQRRRTGVVLESLYHVVADVESPSDKSCAN